MGLRGWYTVGLSMMLMVPLAVGTAAADDADGGDQVRVGTMTVQASSPPMIPDDAVWSDDTFTGVLAGSSGSGNSYEWTYVGVFNGEVADPQDLVDCLESIVQQILDGVPPDEWPTCVE